jgi:hypothetical protein
VKETVWMELLINGISYDRLIIGFIKNPPRKSRWYNANFITLSEGGFKLRECPNTEILILRELCVAE